MAFAIATFNVKDLLEPSDASDRAILPAKLDWIARMIRDCDADVVGLQEIGQPSLLLALLARLDGCRYGEPILGTPDARGIRCALISRTQVIAARVHTAAALTFPVFCEGDPEPFGNRIPLRRGVVQARVDAENIGPIEVFVGHFKSSRPVPLRRTANPLEGQVPTARERAEATLRSTVWRTAEALYVRGLVDATLAHDPAAHVAVTGDLNDVPNSTALRSLGADGPWQLVDCATRVEPLLRYSTLHEAKPVQIDYVLVTSNLYARVDEVRFLNSQLRQHTPAEARDEPLTVDSDHAPLVVRFT